jgi:ferric-dicitrate binding protein FerR (iron transport regulator)
MDRKKAEELVKKYSSGECTPEEEQLVEAYFTKYLENSDGLPARSLIVRDNRTILDTINKHIDHQPAHTEVKRLWLKVAVASMVLLSLSVGLYFYSTNDPSKSIKTEYTADILPGDNKATLTLADGKKINLIDVENGQLAEQSGIKVAKAADGQLVYTVSDDDDSSTKPLYNTIETPVGGQYQVNLPDGSRVWLNAASSLRYPIRFSGGERKVEIKGEAYFEIAHNEALPFKVSTAGQEVKVFGTCFNVMAYQNEKIIKTTLLQGSVQVSSGRASRMLVPGQQSLVQSGSVAIVEHIDLEDVVAWKNGYFKFNENLEGVMNKIARWYNVEVVYQFKPDLSLSFGGEISRSKNLSAVLKIIELTGNVHFKIEGRRVIVMQ